MAGSLTRSMENYIFPIGVRTAFLPSHFLFPFRCVAQESSARLNPKINVKINMIFLLMK